MPMYKILAIIGESGTGKDTLLHKLIKESKFYGSISFNEIISYTTRPKREKETDGINYYFISEPAFQEKITNDTMLEYTIFNNWYYGTALSSLKEDKINIGVFNPQGIRNLLQYDAIDARVIRLCTSEKTRLIRQLNREEHPNVSEIIRRFETDNADFSDLDFEYIWYANEKPEDLDYATLGILEGLYSWLRQVKN